MGILKKISRIFIVPNDEPVTNAHQKVLVKASNSSELDPSQKSSDMLLIRNAERQKKLIKDARQRRTDLQPQIESKPPSLYADPFKVKNPFRGQ